MLSSPLSSIRRISPVYLKRLKKLGLETVRDLIYHFPHRYDDFSKIIPISQIKLGQVQTVQGKILEIKNTRTWRKKMVLTQAIIDDDTAAIKTIWFNQPYLIRNLKRGDIINLAGKIQYNGTSLYFSNPVYEKKVSNKQKLAHTGRLVPVYPETEGLSSRWLRYILRLALPKIIPEIKDFLPYGVIKTQKLLSLKQALYQIHFPDSQAMAQKARQRLAFDELFLIQLYSLYQRQQWQKNEALQIKFNQSLIKDFVSHLPFKLTDAQRKAAWEILQDLEKPQPMNRLLEGDVGSGKTVVACLAALEVIKNGGQVALMAPTEVLAKQHFQTIIKLFQGLLIKIALMTGGQIQKTPTLPQASLTKKRQQIIKEVKQGEIDIVIGTHALISARGGPAVGGQVGFKNLVLAIVDEQHRFGIKQRAALQKEISQITDESPKIIPHLLSMTATPIPRSLALTIYGDLDLSLLDELPKGRKKIITKIIAPGNREKAYDFIRQQVKKGRQVFVICPRIEPQSSDVAGLSQPVSFIVQRSTSDDTGSDKRKTKNLPAPACLRRQAGEKRSLSWAEVKAVKAEYEKLSQGVFPELRIAMLHGRLKPKEKNKIMQNFRNKKTDILVSTSVIEVGIDIPNATIMMIEGADRFGLAQLHQFRGRVGRGKHQSYCFLFTDSAAKNTRHRLKALIKCEDGFKLAEKDLQIRGPGEFFGTRQWGLPDLSMASFLDIRLIKVAREEAQKLLQEDSEFKKYSLLREKLRAFGERVHLE